MNPLRLAAAGLAFAAACCARAPGADAVKPDRDFEIRVTDDPPVPFPVRRFSVRQTNAVYFRGRYYAYVDVVPWDNPYHPNSYDTTIHVYSSDDGLHWRYEREALSRGARGAWDAGGVATPGACVVGDQVWLAYSGRQFRYGGGHRYIGLAQSADPLGPFKRRGEPLLTADGHLDDPQLVVDPRDACRVQLYYRLADPREGYLILCVETRDAGARWSAPRVILRCEGNVRARETLDAKWIDGRLVLALIEHFHRGPMKVAFYVSTDGERFEPCRKKYLNDYLHLPLRFAYGPNFTFIPGPGGRVDKIALAGFLDAEGHYTQWVYRLAGRPK